MRLSEIYKEFLIFRSTKGTRSRKTAARYEMMLRNFCICMHDPELKDLSVHHVIWYLHELERLGWSPSGRNLIAVAIRKLIEFANLRGYDTFDEQLIPLPERQYNIPRVTNAETFRKVASQIPEDGRPHHVRNRAILHLLWDTGMRSGELCSLDLRDLDLKKRTALIRTEKNRGRRPIRQIFWTPKTNGYLLDWISKSRDLKEKFPFADPEALFVSISKCPQNNVRGQRLSTFNVAEVMRVLSNRAKIPTMNAHSIRHSMGRDTIRTAKNTYAVSNILGHSSLDSSMVYSMLFGDDLKQQWQKVIKRRKV